MGFGQISEGCFRLRDHAQQPAEPVGLIGGQRSQNPAVRQRLARDHKPVEFGQRDLPVGQSAVNDIRWKSLPDWEQNALSDTAW